LARGIEVRFIAAWQDGYLAPISGTICIAAAVHFLYTFWRRRAFLINEHVVSFGRTKLNGFIWEDTWPRASVGEIRLNATNGKLLIRITGRDMKEYFISSKRQVTQEVAQVLQEAMISFNRRGN
jgi:hypothetical protein